VKVTGKGSDTWILVRTASYLNCFHHSSVVVTFQKQKTLDELSKQATISMKLHYGSICHVHCT
jgi:hypothetical protein